jgi:hypothetical protein
MHPIEYLLDAVQIRLTQGTDTIHIGLMLCHDALHFRLLARQELVVDAKFWSPASQNPGHGPGLLGASGDLA